MQIYDQIAYDIYNFQGTKESSSKASIAIIESILQYLLVSEHKQELYLHKGCMSDIGRTIRLLRQHFVIPIGRILQTDEGFHTSDDEVLRKPQPKQLKRKTTFEEERPNPNVDLLDKIQQRDQIIQSMTVGYLKDVQHLREMLIRRDMYPETEVFDVNYYDLTKNLPAELKEFIQQKIQDVYAKSKANIVRLQTELKKSHQELEQVYETLKKLVGQTDVYSVLKSLLYFETDLFKIWRGIQDIIGNQKIFDLFEKRKGGYGIDYQQIDNLISQSQASHRVYQSYKDNIDQQYILFTSQTGKELKRLRDENQQLRDQIEDLKVVKEIDIIVIRQAIKNDVENIYEIKEQTIKDKFVQKLQEYSEELFEKDKIIQMKKCNQRAGLYKWLYQIIKMKQKAKQGLQRSRSTQKILDVEQNVWKIQKELQLEIKKSKLLQEEQDLKFMNLKSEYELLQQKHRGLQFNYDMQIKKYEYLEQNSLYFEHTTEYFEKIYSMLLKKFSLPYQENQFKYNQFKFDRVEQNIKLFEEKINSIDLFNSENIKEATTQLIKKQIAYKKMMGNYGSDVFTITDIHDIRKHLLPNKESNNVEVQVDEQTISTEPQSNLRTIQSVNHKETRGVLKIKVDQSVDDDQTNFEAYKRTLDTFYDQNLKSQEVQKREIFTFGQAKSRISYKINHVYTQTDLTDQDKEKAKDKDKDKDVDLGFESNYTKININELEQYKNIKNQGMQSKQLQFKRPQSRYQTFGSIVSQLNVNRISQIKQHNQNSFLKINNHKLISLDMKTPSKTDVSGSKKTYFVSNRTKIVLDQSFNVEAEKTSFQIKQRSISKG